MPHSMTAFARVETETEYGRAAWEIRSVNHRYAEISVRTPDDFRGLEPMVRERINGRVKRGKIDCTLRIDRKRDDFSGIQVNRAAAESVLAAVADVQAMSDQNLAVSALDVLRWPGVTTAEEVDHDAASAQMLGLLDQALGEFVEMRAREGEKLAAMIAQRLDGILIQHENLLLRVPQIIESVRERHLQKISELADGMDQGRVEQECALLVQRLDVAEELDRLKAHVEEVRHVLGQKDPIGRRLDFLMQELNREANTLGSKSAHVDTTGASIELKVLIEQMREQVQNIE